MKSTKRYLVLAAVLPLLFSFVRCQNKGGGGSDLIGAAYEGGRSTNGALGLFTIDVGGGLLASSTATVSAGQQVSHAVSTVDGRFLYIANYASNNIYQYSLSGKTPTALTPASIETEQGPRRLAVHPNGTYLYVSNYSNATISQYSINQNGTLAELTPATVAATSPTGLAITSDGKLLYAAGQNGLFQFSVGGSGVLTALTPGTVTLGTTVEEVIVSPDNLRVYALNTALHKVHQFNVGGDGKLTAMTINTIDTGGQLPKGIAISPDNKWLYVTNSTSNNVAQFSISSSTSTPGSLTALVPVTITAGTEPLGIVVSSDSRYVYVGNKGSNDFSQYSIGFDGTLTALTSTTVSAPDTNPYVLMRIKSN